nr:uncharacterized protein LOC133606706 [Nerophis lumbriciformis]
MAHLRSTEKRLKKNPEKVTSLSAEIAKLIQAGYVKKLSHEETEQSTEAWYLPYHLVFHNEKARLVFNCSFRHQGVSVNDQLLPGPTLGPSLLGVLLRFRQHQVAVSGDIRAMFHQIRLLPEDRPLLRFIWRDLRSEDPPDVYEWQVLPFGTTCSPCCAIFALQQHARNHQHNHPGLLKSVEQSFYVDNCLKSFTDISEAAQQVTQLRKLMAEGGFDLRQWASNQPEVLAQVPPEGRSTTTEQWLSQNRVEPQEPALGLRWNCATDTLGYQRRNIEHTILTMRTAYQVLASQYDPLGFIVPYTTRAKVLIQQLWSKQRSWEDSDLPRALQEAWKRWESELQHLDKLSIPRCYTPIPTTGSQYDLHIFCDASERAYGAVAYVRLQTKDVILTSFIMARSRVAPKRQQSMPRLELCAALAGAQLAKVLKTEMTLPLQKTTLWSDSTTVLEWLQSDSCRFKVFVGTRVSEIQELTDRQSWRYVDTHNNPADDITRGKPLLELAEDGRWRQGPPFLRQSAEYWPKRPEKDSTLTSSELKNITFCGLAVVQSDNNIPDASLFNTWKELVRVTQQAGQEGPRGSTHSQTISSQEAEFLLLRRCQVQTFPADIMSLKTQNAVSAKSRLACLSPEWDSTTGLIRVGGRLRRLQNPDLEEIHPIVLDPKHQITKLLIKDMDERLLHPGTERVYAELRRHYWILRGRQAVRHHQHNCPSCQRWRAQPTVPRMADLPPQRLRLLCPPFHSTGVDCFGPYLVKVGRRSEKRWGVIFKCLTTRAVHIELLNSMDADAFLLALRRFIARRGRPREVLSDCGTNFRGAERELRTVFAEMEPQLREQLTEYQIDFKFNPPNAPHFGGAWEREIRSIKASLQVAVGGQSVTEDVLHTTLVEVEGILNSNPLGYVSSDVSDLDPITPNILLMGRRDSALPQVVYVPAVMGRRRWRHCQTLVDQFWIHFIRSYLPTLQTRSKWQRSSENITINTVVLMVDPSLPRAQWPIGRVVKTIPSQDGQVRAAEVMVKSKVYIRPVARLIPLPSLEDDSKDT